MKKTTKAAEKLTDKQLIKLQARIEALQAKAAPLRKAYDLLVNEDDKLCTRDAEALEALQERNQKAEDKLEAAQMKAEQAREKAMAKQREKVAKVDSAINALRDQFDARKRQLREAADSAAQPTLQ